MYHTIQKNTILALALYVLLLFSQSSHSQTAPINLHCEFIENTLLVTIDDATPELGWILLIQPNYNSQTAYEILVDTSVENIKKNIGDIWSSGKVKSAESSNITYAGQKLKPNTTYYWKVRIWGENNIPTPYSHYHSFKTGDLTLPYATAKYPLISATEYPQTIKKILPNATFFDFGKASFGTLFIKSGLLLSDSANVELGEMLSDSFKINTQPPGTIRGLKGKFSLENYSNGKIVVLPKFTPPSWEKQKNYIDIIHPITNIMPFRYATIENCTNPDEVRRETILYPFNDSASYFRSSNDTLNRIWELCKYTIKATTFAGVYVDGDRERKPYEADAYINQLAHYCTDREFALPRFSYEYFFAKPTWPTEWKSHSVLMAWVDYMYTGNSESLEYFYNQLKNDKAMLRPVTANGLLLCQYRSKKEKNDIIDWPLSERDNYEIRDTNTVVNAFYFESLKLMAKIAGVLNKQADVDLFLKMAENVKTQINTTLFNSSTGLYIDATGSKHSSLHANMFPLVFGMVPNDRKAHIIEFIKSRRMACSVYGAQYLFDALYNENESDYALRLLTNNETRGWVNMLRSGSTIALEAWDIKFKKNIDWNHAWGAAPANIIPRNIFGIQPLTPGFSKFKIKLQTGSLTFAEIKTPTIKGDIKISLVNNASKKLYSVRITVPANTIASVSIPKLYSGKLTLVGGKLASISENGYLNFELTSGSHLLELK